VPEDQQLELLRRMKARRQRRAAPASTPVRRVLVVEDDGDTAQMMQAVLEQMGYEVALVADGAQALAAARDFGPDAVLMDIGLPHKDGYQLAVEMHADPLLRGVPLVAVTGLASRADRDGRWKPASTSTWPSPCRRRRWGPRWMR
jgi:CheY-like chemotaxis protein